ncbi:MAG: hypothetical protein V4537_07810 [Pseudomonadota bacterium]
MIRFPLLLAIATVATPALAQQMSAADTAKFKADFAKGDLDHDGVITAAEVETRMNNLAAAGVDAGLVSRGRRAGMAWFTGADTDKDGKVTEAEAQVAFAAKLAK